MFRSVQYPLKPASRALLCLAGATWHTSMLHLACNPQSPAFGMVSVSRHDSGIDAHHTWGA